MKDKVQILKVISASLLGDAWIEYGKYNKEARFRLKLIEKHKDHLEYIGNYLENITSVHYGLHILEGKSVIKNKPVMLNNAITLSTKSHPIYTNFRNRMYGTGKKSVDPHALTLIDSEFLAIWYQQDGFLHHANDSKNPTPDVQFCTDCFSYADCHLLRTSVIEKTGFILNLQRRKRDSGLFSYRLVLSRKQTASFIDSVLPFIQPSFMYKTNLERQTAYAEEIVRTDGKPSEENRNDSLLAMPE